MNPATKESLVRALSAIIDHDEPPGLAARTLARSVVSLVQDREPDEAVMLTGALDGLAANPEYARGTRSW
jgi:hypothetical protein